MTSGNCGHDTICTDIQVPSDQTFQFWKVSLEPGATFRSFSNETERATQVFTA